MSSTEELNSPRRQQKRTFDAMEGNRCPPLRVDSGRPESSQHDKSSVPRRRAQSKFQKIPTKNPAKQYYSKQEMGGWGILNEKEAVMQMKREQRMVHMKKADSIRDELGGVMQNKRGEERSAKLEEGGVIRKPSRLNTFKLLITNQPTYSSNSFQKAKSHRLSPPDRVHSER